MCDTLYTSVLLICVFEVVLLYLQVLRHQLCTVKYLKTLLCKIAMRFKCTSIVVWCDMSYMYQIGGNYYKYRYS